MSKQIFVNLPVRDLDKAKAFHVALGHTINPKFTDANAACIVVSDSIFFMLLKREYFQTFTDKAIPDAHQSAQVLLCLSQDSQDAVNAIVDKAVAAGGRPEPTPTQDMGFMYGRSFEDPDGHIWENVWMNMEAVPEHVDQAAA